MDNGKQEQEQEQEQKQEPQQEQEPQPSERAGDSNNAANHSAGHQSNEPDDDDGDDDDNDDDDDDDDGEPPPSADKQILLRWLSGKLGFPVIRMIKYSCEPPEYRMVTPYGDVKFKDVNEIITLTKCRAAIAAVTGKIPKYKQDTWITKAQIILDTCELVDVSQNEHIEMAEWLEEYLVREEVHKDLADVKDELDRQPFWRGETCCIYIALS